MKKQYNKYAAIPILRDSLERDGHATTCRGESVDVVFPELGSAQKGSYPAGKAIR